MTYLKPSKEYNKSFDFWDILNMLRIFTDNATLLRFQN